MTTLVCDIGATHTRLALTDGKELRMIQRFDTDTSTKGIENMLTHMQRYIENYHVTRLIGGVPGQIDRQTGRLIHVPNIPEWAGRRIGREIAQELDIPVELHNDVEMVGLGEAVHGAGIGHAVVAYVTVSSGVNGARIVNGRIDPSRYGYEIGAQLVADSAGRVTTWEDLTGGVAMARRYGVEPQSLRDDERVWRREAKHVAAGLYNTILHWSPDVVVFGGTMMRDISIRDVSSELEALPRVLSGRPPLIRSALVDDGGLYGAMVLAGVAN